MASIIRTLSKAGDLIYPNTFTNAVKHTNGKLLSSIIDGIQTDVGDIGGSKIDDAPKDGKSYVRKDGAWQIIDQPYETSELDHAPTPQDLTYVQDGKTIPYPLGAEVYLRSFDFTIFYRLYDHVDGEAYWKETGRADFSGYIFLKGADYFDDTVKIIKQGILDG